MYLSNMATSDCGKLRTNSGEIRLRTKEIYNYISVSTWLLKIACFLCFFSQLDIWQSSREGYICL